MAARRDTGTSSGVIGGFYNRTAASSLVPASVGYNALPPRKSVSDPQSALIQALASPRGRPSDGGGAPTGGGAAAAAAAAAAAPTQGDLLMAAKARQQAARSSAAAKAAPMTLKVGPPCDRCDGNHRTADCPYFKGGRDDHEDARVGLGKGGTEAADAPPVIVSGRVVSQPADGSCLFHSLGHLLGDNAKDLRLKVTRFIEENPDAEIAGTALRKWVQWDCGLQPGAYATRLRQPGSWGGALEMAIIADMKSAIVHVYERHTNGFKRIATFGDDGDDGGAERRATAHVLYRGRVHYDALQVTGESSL